MASTRASSLETTVFAVPTDNSLASLLVGEKWGGAVGEPLTISYSFATASSRYGYSGEWTTGGAPLDAEEQAAAELALANYAAVADITFIETAETATEVGDIRFAESAMLAYDGASAWTYTPDSGAWAADVWLNPTVFSAWYEDDPGSWNYVTLLHEIGHALGLKHSFEADLYSGAVLPEDTDTYHYTVMTYYAYPGDMWAEASIYPTTLMLYDIAAVQYLYGANWDYASGDDSYVYSGTGAYLETIWDGGGIDAIVYDSTTGGVIDLRDGQFSQLGQPVTYSNGASDPRTVAIAYDAVIENAVGGAGDDLIIGNDGVNVLSGGAGADEVDAGAGNDAVLGGEGADGLDGSAGDDLMLGGAGDDVYAVDSPGDGIREAAGGGTDQVWAACSYQLGDNVENLALIGSAAIDGVGNEQANILYGNDAANRLTGGMGADTITGGGGADQFCYMSPAEGGDTITDFAAGTDQVLIYGAAFGNLGVGTLSAADFDAWFAFDAATATLSYDGTVLAVLDGVTTLSAANIIVV